MVMMICVDLTQNGRLLHMEVFSSPNNTFTHTNTEQSHPLRRLARVKDLGLAVGNSAV